jgi:hypothetical protein
MRVRCVNARVTKWVWGMGMGYELWGGLRGAGRGRNMSMESDL